VPGKTGQAFSFDGDDRIAVPDSDSLEIAPSITIEGWVKIRTWPTDNSFGAAMIVYRGDDRPGFDPFYVAVLDGGVLRFAINSPDSQLAAIDAPVTTNTFIHFAGTLDNDSGAMKLYIDGVLAAQTNTALRPLGELAGAALGIGHSQAGSGFDFGFEGLVDELKLYSRALTAQEVQILYNSQPCSEDSPRLVLPNVSATVDDGGGSGLLNTQLRHQIVYEASQFLSQVIRITELRMRPSAQWGNAFTSTIPNLQINLSTTSVGANAMNEEFAQNVGSNDTVVFQGPLTVSSRFVGPAAGPKEFDIIIPLTTPFIYDPSRGNLLIDFRNSSGSGAAFVDAGQRTDDGSSRAFALSVDATRAGTRDPGAEVFQIVYGVAAGIAPTITGHPQNRSVFAGESVTLNVSATGSAPLTYQWLKGGNPVPGATGSSLTLTNVQVSDSGTYSVVVSNAYGVATSQPGTVTVSGSARLVLPNISATVDDGGGSGLLNTQLRHQIVYDASQFPSNFIRITELRMRPSATWGNAFTSTIPNLQINLSTTGVEADAMHADFAQNIGSNDMVVFQGPLTVSSRFVGPAAGPKEFDIVIPLTTAFIYDPRLGNLLIDFRNFSGSSASFVDAGQRTDDGSSRAFALSVDATTAETRDPGAEVFQIVYSAVGGVTPTNTMAQLTPMTAASAGDFVFSFNAVGGNYVVEASTDLINWSVVTNVVGVSGLVEVTDPKTTTRQRFFRARLVP
jgi:hypothetical protein